MDVLRELVGQGSFPPVVLVHLATVEQAEAFFATRWPEARAIADPEKRLYQAFDIGRGGLWQLLGPKALRAGLSGLGQGYGVGIPTGDVWMMSARFLVAGSRILWEDRHAHAGAGTDFDGVQRAYGSFLANQEDGPR